MKGKNAGTKVAVPEGKGGLEANSSHSCSVVRRKTFRVADSVGLQRLANGHEPGRGMCPSLLPNLRGGHFISWAARP